MPCELFERYQRDGDARSFALLVERYQPLVYSVVRRILNNQADIEDAVQETFVRLTEHAGTIHGSVTGWLSVTARSISIDVVRRDIRTRQRDSTAQHLADARDPLNNPAAQTELRKQLEAAIAQLDGPNQQLLFDRFFDRAPLRKIAVEQGVNVSVISRRVSRALADLTSALQDMGCQTPTDLLMHDPSLAVPRQKDPLRFATDWRAMDKHACLSNACLAPGWQRPIRVGVFVGYVTSRVVSSRGYRLGIEAQVRMTTLMVDPAYELIGIVEPDTSHLGPIERTLREYELTAGLIDGNDLDALRALDVIFLGPNFGMVESVLETVLRAVESGVGLMNEWWISFDHVTVMRNSAQVRSILAKPPVHKWHTERWHDQPMAATVIRQHPATPSLCAGQRIMFNSCGPAYFPVDDAEVLAVKDYRVKPHEHGQPNVGELPMPGIVVGHIGAGRALVTNFAQMRYMRENLTIRDRFMPDALQWLAEPNRER